MSPKHLWDPFYYELDQEARTIITVAGVSMVAGEKGANESAQTCVLGPRVCLACAFTLVENELVKPNVYSL